MKIPWRPSQYSLQNKNNTKSQNENTAFRSFSLAIPWLFLIQKQISERPDLAPACGVTQAPPPRVWLPEVSVALQHPWLLLCSLKAKIYFFPRMFFVFLILREWGLGAFFFFFLFQLSEKQPGLRRL